VLDAQQVPTYGVITAISNTGATKNPSAGSSWKMTIALANGDARSLTLTASQIGRAFTVRDQSANISLPTDDGGSRTLAVQDLFDLYSAGNVRRERRWMVTGNLLAGFAKYPGQIVSYTRDDGSVAQGVLMRRGFDFDKAKKSGSSLSLGTPARVMEFLRRAGNGAVVVDGTGALRIVSSGGKFTLTTPASKREGGKLYLDKALTRALGQDFYKRGNLMSAVSVSEAALERAVEHLLTGRQDIKLMPGSNPDVAREVLGLGESKPGKPAFSRAGGARLMSSASVQSVVDAVVSRWAQRPSIVVVQSMQDPRVPEAVRDEDAAQREAGATGSPDGFFYDGVVYLVADGIASPRQAMEALFHEVLGHYGLRAVFGDALNGILDQIGLARPDLMRPKAAQYGKVLTLAASRERVNSLRRQAGMEPLSGAALESAAVALLRRERREVAEEILADMAKAQPELGFVKRAVAALRTWLRQNVPGLEGLRLTDAEIIRSYILPARGWVERGAMGANADGARTPAVALSRSATKSVTANIDRGLRALAEAVTGKTTVHRAMFRSGMGWVDFVWGDEGKVKSSGRTVGGRGLSHIIEARMRKDGLTEAEALRVLAEMVRAVASGAETKRVESNSSTSVKIEHDGYRVGLVKNPGSNAWIITAFEIDPDARPAGYAAAAPTQSAASLSRDGMGAGSLASDAVPPSLGGATRRDSTQRGSPAGAESPASMAEPNHWQPKKGTPAPARR
jgi:hypothetical protein